MIKDHAAALARGAGAAARAQRPRVRGHPYVFFFPPRRGGASHVQMGDFGIMEMWYSRVPQNHHDLQPLLGWKDMHILFAEEHLYGVLGLRPLGRVLGEIPKSAVIWAVL